MLQVPELKRAMGFPEEHVFSRGTRRDKIKLIGNAVCPPVMMRVIEALTHPQPERTTITEAGHDVTAENSCSNLARPSTDR
jgi:hypothetical protein